MQIDISELQDQVVEMWLDQGIEFFDTNQIDDYYFDTEIKDEYQDILDDPMECINQLGYESLSQYIAANRE